MNEPDITYLPISVYEKRLSGRVKHTLYEVNLERNTAFCTACGYTEIHVAKPRIREKPKFFCITRFRELSEAEAEKRRLRRRKPRHLLSEIDPEKRTAICSVCGRTDIWIHHVHGSIFYVCGTYYREVGRRHQRARYSRKVSSPSAHTLSQIDEAKKTAFCSRCGPVEIYIWKGNKNICRCCSNAPLKKGSLAQKLRREINSNLINRYKVEHGCNQCGYNANILRLFLFSGEQKKRKVNIERLLRLQKDRLLQKFESCYVLCSSCCG